MHKFYGPWCSLFQHLLDREKLSQSRFAELVGSQQQAIHAYLVGRSRPPIEELSRWADVLHLNAEDRERFIWFALQGYTPTAVWERVEKLSRVLVDQESSLQALRLEVANLRSQLVGCSGDGGATGQKCVQ